MDAWEILSGRGFIQQCTGPDALAAAFRTGPVSFYVGFDPTADSLHVGHMLPMMAMAHLQRAGHTPIAVVGGGTAMVGDPSGKSEMRQMLTEETIAQNLLGLKSQLQRFLVVDGVAGHMVDNAEWLMNLNYIGFLRDIGKHFSVNRMLAAETYRIRFERGLSFIEFNYQVLQAYDFLALHRRFGCNLQIGGDDQWANILAGTELIRRIEGKDAHGLTLPLITTASGEKMGKTAAGAVWLDIARTSGFDFFQYWLNVDDRDAIRFLKLYTFVDLAEINELAKLEGADIRQVKRRLAKEVTTLVHGADVAQAAETAAAAMAKGEASADLPTSGVTTGVTIIDALVSSGLAKSKGDARRLIENGGVRLGNDKIADVKATVPDLGAGLVLKVGKSQAVRLVQA